ncbi:MAG: YHYH protein [Acidimicrobiia bacterium]|nr:YHYH protein [Acidimicrobiia bacterium]
MFHRAIPFGLLVAIALVAGCSGDEAGEATTTTAAAAGASTTTTIRVETASGDSASPYVDSYVLMNETYGTEVVVTVEGGVRTIESNGLPDHETGQFPNAGNPNSISAQSYSYTFPAQPNAATMPTPYNVPQPFGIAVNGVVLDPFAAEWYQNDRDSGWQLAALANPLGFDDNNAHVQPTGAYHYHGAPTALLTTSEFPELIGFAGDGFPIYGPYGYNDPADPTSGVRELVSSYRLKRGERPDGPGGAYDGTYVEDYEYVEGYGDLDECNGREGVTPEWTGGTGTYYYIATLDWPFLGRCFVGTIADSFELSGPSGR